jgi:uncharacterized protein
VTDALLADTQPFSVVADVHENGNIEAPTLQAIMARRRSIRRLQDGPFSADTKTRLLEAIRLTPAAYNLPPWRVALVHERRDDLWAEIERGFCETLNGDRLERYLERLRGFREGVAVALIFADRRVERALREEKGASAEVAQGFVLQALGMVQLSLWLAITAEGLVTSLQHWDEWFGARAARFAGLTEDDFALIATMPIGYAAEEPKAVERAAAEQICAVDPGNLA